MITSVTFIGLGNMGLPMAFNLLRSGIKLFVYNRTKERANKLVEEGADLIDSPDQAFEKSPLVITMLSDDAALISISNEILKNAKPGCVHVSMSTVSPTVSRELARKHQEKGVTFIAAPVFGRPDAAKEAKLWICISGDHQVKAQVEPILHFMGQKIYDFGDDYGAANVVKLTGNFLIVATLEMVSEAYANAEKNGIDLKTLYNFLVDTIFNNPVFKTYGKNITDKNFKAGFKMNLALKDITLFDGISNGLDLPMLDIVKEKLKIGIDAERGDLDVSAISLSSLELKNV